MRISSNIDKKMRWEWRSECLCPFWRLSLGASVRLGQLYVSEWADGRSHRPWSHFPFQSNRTIVPNMKNFCAVTHHFLSAAAGVDALKPLKHSPGNENNISRRWEESNSILPFTYRRQVSSRAGVERTQKRTQSAARSSNPGAVICRFQPAALLSEQLMDFKRVKNDDHPHKPACQIQDRVLEQHFKQGDYYFPPVGWWKYEHMWLCYLRAKGGKLESDGTRMYAHAARGRWVFVHVWTRMSQCLDNIPVHHQQHDTWSREKLNVFKWICHLNNHSSNFAAAKTYKSD